MNTPSEEFARMRKALADARSAHEEFVYNVKSAIGQEIALAGADDRTVLAALREQHLELIELRTKRYGE